MKREELKAYRPYANRDGFYHKSEADSVMDAMEKQIRILENDKEEMYDANLVLQARIKELEAKLKETDEVMDSCRGLIESASVMSKSAKDKLLNRIKELEAEVIGYKASLERANFKACEKDARIKELEQDLDNEIELQGKAIKCINELRAQNDNHIPNDREKVAELEAENKALRQANIDCNAHFETLKEDYARLKAQVPKWHKVADGDLPKEEKLDSWFLIKHSNGTLYFADWDNDLKIFTNPRCEYTSKVEKVIEWCEIRLTPPTTEESSETENDN